MKFMPGYQIRTDREYIDYIISEKENIHEVYFSWGDIPNGRNNQLQNDRLLPHEAMAREIEDLKALTDSGIDLNLLLNGNCYGDKSQSRAFFNKIGDTVDYLSNSFSLKSLTTTSPLIAKFIKCNFSNLEIRASVNMKIGTVEGMDYVGEYFDAYYMQREYNRDFETIKKLKKWCDKNSKKLYILANSGCLNNCSAQIFHDNLVAHESEIAFMDNAYEFKGMCREYLKNEEHLSSLLHNTNFIRPEDMALYDEYFTAAKLATRVSKNPVHILKSYINQKYSGNILDILEPSHSVYPYVLENGNPIRLVRLNSDIPIFNNDES